MKGTHAVGFVRSGAAIIAAAFTLSACLSSDEGTSPWTGPVDKEITVSGSVGDGPAVNSTLSIRSRSGESLATFNSDLSGTYRVSIIANSEDYPLLIDATGGRDIVTDEAPDFVMHSAVLGAGSNITANVNPFSTLAYQAAADMNAGLTSTNLRAAEDLVLAAASSGLSTMAGGPTRTPIDTANISEVIKASETLAEVVRRTRDALTAAGRSATGDSVVEALGSDLIDGVIEGNGGSRADPRVSAVAVVSAAQVLLESMANELHVNGANATGDIQRAIDQVAGGPVSPTLDELPVTAGMLAQAVVGLEAAHAVTGESRILDLIQALDGVQPGLKPALVRTLLPGDYRSALDGAVQLAAAGDDSIVATINDTARNGSTTSGTGNRAPTISGQPPATVRAGMTYTFTPTASDLDGDPLTFDIAARPEWASFDAASGRLTGTPQAAHTGRYDGIVITVSDGELDSSIGPFSITVTTNNTGPSISGTPPTEVGAGEAYTFTPQASDPDGDTLRFSISGIPSWASFDMTTGRLSGTPDDVHVGMYPDIVISVSYGNASASLAPFSIEVTSPGAATGSVTLNWTPPTENEDGSQLMNLAGYRLYWGRDGGALSNTVTINNPSVTRYVVGNLTPGTYEFAATAINGDGVESRFSNGVTKVVP